SHATQTFVVVSELTKAKSKSSQTSSVNKTKDSDIKLNINFNKLYLVLVGILAVNSVQAAVSIGITRNNVVYSAGATANGEAIAIGQVTATANSVAIGGSYNGTQHNQANSRGVAIGYGAQATGDNEAIAIGAATKAEGDQSIAIGANVIVTGSSSIGIGGDDLKEASLKNLDGSLTGSVKNGDLNLGNINTEFRKISGRDLVDPNNKHPKTYASGEASVAVGVQSIAGHLSTAFGTGTLATGIASMALGVTANASGIGSFAGGPNAAASGRGAIAIGGPF
ncbi:ESPR-type extended signal peptide-containing protein, partial [Actinobacillus pleuropneumoniae]|uniref:ESPR-type extended signal peptide-containing protein n=1 Tax=Actinobacillus pleuropneumoniae TaxID=715 RepID=UPI003B01C4B0